MSHFTEHDGEPVKGLPAALPAGESMLWQGKPDFTALAINVFHVRKIALYFAALALWRVITLTNAGGGLFDSMITASTILAAGVAAVGLLLMFAWLTARTTIYTLTDKRVVLRIGIALPMTVNLPLSIMSEANLKRYRSGSGDIFMTPEAGQRASYIVLWPHVRPFSVGQPQPAMRALVDPELVAEKIATALGSSSQLSSAVSAAEPHGVAVASQ